MSTVGSIGKLIEALQHQVATLEQELRETSGELEKTEIDLRSSRAKYDCYKHSAMQTVGALRLKLTEATALLERNTEFMANYEKHYFDPIVRELRLANHAFLARRAPAQPAAQAHQYVGAPTAHGVDYPAQPAASTPPVDRGAPFPVCSSCLKPMQCLTDNEDDWHPLWACVDGSYCGEPAAPEPSAVIVSNLKGAIAAHESSIGALKKGLATTNMLVEDKERLLVNTERELRSAEARLAAVLKALDEPVPLLTSEGLLRRITAIRALLTPAPSPGAGEGTER